MIDTIFEIDEELMQYNVSKIQDILNGSQAKDSILASLFICKECIEQGIDRFPDRKDGIIDSLKQLFECVVEDLEEYEPNSGDES